VKEDVYEKIDKELLEFIEDVLLNRYDLYVIYVFNGEACEARSLLLPQHFPEPHIQILMANFHAQSQANPVLCVLHLFDFLMVLLQVKHPSTHTRTREDCCFLALPSEALVVYIIIIPWLRGPDIIRTWCLKPAWSREWLCDHVRRCENATERMMEYAATLEPKCHPTAIVKKGTAPGAAGGGGGKKEESWRDMFVGKRLAHGLIKVAWAVMFSC